MYYSGSFLVPTIRKSKPDTNKMYHDRGNQGYNNRQQNRMGKKMKDISEKNLTNMTSMVGYSQIFIFFPFDQSALSETTENRRQFAGSGIESD